MKPQEDVERMKRIVGNRIRTNREEQINMNEFTLNKEQLKCDGIAMVVLNWVLEYGPEGKNSEFHM
jgi:hypothetical protein